MLPFKKRAQFLCSTSNLKDTEEENKTDTFLTSCTTHEKDALAASMRHVGDDETKGVRENEGGGGDGRSIGGEGEAQDDGEYNCASGVARGEKQEEETRVAKQDDGCGDSALGDGKQDGTKEVVEKECGGLLEQEKMAEIEDVGHDCNNALDIVDDEKQRQSVDPIRIVEGSSSHCAIDTTAKFIKGGKGEGEEHGQVAEMVEAGGDENIRKREPEEETNEANNPLDDVVSIIVHDGGSGGEQVQEAEETELPVIHQPVRRLRLFGVDIDVPQEEVQPTTETGNDTSLTNQESNGHGLSLQKPKIGLRLMGFDL